MSAHPSFVPVLVPERFLGQTLGGRYRLTRLLGAGAYAWVYEAVDVELEITVAVKVLRPEHTGNDVSEARFRREATTAAKLRHPNIVTVRDVGKGEGATWVAMDLVPMSLSRRLEVMPYLPETDVVRVGLDVAAALSVAHASDIIHRDIKPDNILIGSTGECIVCDFGLARALTSGADLSATNQVLGTPHYFSPEQARGEPLDGRSDLYALGITLYRAATGKLPFEGEDWYAVARQHVDDVPSSPRKHVASISPAFEAILLKLLAKKPADRFSSATALADALSRLPSAPSTGSRLALTPGGTTTTHTITARSRTWRNAAIVAGVVLVTAVGFAFTRGGPMAFARLTSAQSQDTVPTAADSLQLASDSAIVPDTLGDSTKTVSVPLRTLEPPARPAARFASFEITTARDPIAIFIDGERMGVAPWRTEQMAPGRRVVRAELLPGPGVFVGCEHNQRTDTVNVRAGASIKHTVAVARCSRVWLNVTPADARVSFVDSTGDVVHKGVAAILSPAVVRAGAWRLVAEAPRCARYDAVDTLAAGADTVRFTMFCGGLAPDGR